MDGRRCHRRPSWIAVGLVAGASLLVLGGCRGGLSVEQAARFQSAQDAFDNASQPGEYLQAAASFQSLLDSGVMSAAVLYNQGNAYMRAGERAQAVACYRRAQRYRPRDPYLEANLKFALGTSTAAPPRTWVHYVFFWQDWLGYGEKFSWAWVAAALSFGLGLAALWKNPGRWVSRTAWVTTVVTAILALSALYDLQRFRPQSHAVIRGDNVTARKGNDDSYEPAFNQPLGVATECRVLERRGPWLRIQLAAGPTGWVKQDDAVVY